MKKYITLAVLLICMLSFVVSPVMAAQDDDRIITSEQMAKDKLKEHKEKKVVEQKASHNKADFTNIVPGMGNLKYESEKVPKGFEKKDETVTMVSWHDKGKLHIRDTEHRTATIQVPWSTLQEIKGFDGEHVRIWHYNDAGICDGKWIQTVSNEGGYAYLEDVPFSEIIVSGFTGSYSKIDNEIDITDTINLGRTFDSNEVSSVTLTINDQYSSKTDPYDINNSGLVAWLKLDDDFTDSSGNGNDGTNYGVTFENVKYNSGGFFDGDAHYIDTDINFDMSQPYTIIVWIEPNATDKFILGGKSNANWYIQLRSDNNLDFASGSALNWNTGVSCDSSLQHFVFAYDGAKKYVYKNGVEIASTTQASEDGSGLYIGRYGGYTTNSFNGTMDELLIYNRSLSESEIKELYYISASSIQAKTNSHAEYSTEWNSSADNPLSVPFGESESISSITFNQPESIEQNGITIYDPINVLFNVTATVGYTEDTYLIEEFCDEGFYIDQYAVEISHTPSASNANGEISYNPTDSLCSDIMGKSWTYELDSNNPNASITTFNMNSLVIDTGAITAGTEYTYVVTAETSDEVAQTELESDISSAIQMSGILPMLLIAASILGLLIGMLTGNIEFDTAVKSVGVVIVLSVVLYVGIAILNTIATALG